MRGFPLEDAWDVSLVLEEKYKREYLLFNSQRGCMGSLCVHQVTVRKKGTLWVVEEYERKAPWLPTTYVTWADQPPYIQVYEIIDGLTEKPMLGLFRYLHLSILPKMGSLHSRLI